VISKWSEIPKRRPVVVQHYIASPYLINSSKFDLRIYVYVTCYDPLRIYIYDNGLARFASVKYATYHCFGFITLPSNAPVVEKTEYCDERVYLRVCPRAYLRNHTSKLYSIFLHIAYGRGSVLLCLCCSTLSASCFLDDFIFR